MTKKYTAGLTSKIVQYLTENKVRVIPDEMNKILGREPDEVGSVSTSMSAYSKKPNSSLTRIKRPGTNTFEYWVKEAAEKRPSVAITSRAGMAEKISGAEAIVTHVSEKLNTLTMSIATLISSVEEANILLLEVKEELEKKPDVDEDVLKALHTLQVRLNQ